MPAYVYTGEDARYYPTLGIEARPADDDGPATVAEFDTRPAAPADGQEAAAVPDGARYAPDDGRWEPTKKKPTPPPAPAQDAPPADSPKGD